MNRWTASVPARLLWLTVAVCAAFAQPAESALVLAPGSSGAPEEIDVTSQPVIEPQTNRPFSFAAGGGVISGVVADRVVLTMDGQYAFETRVFIDRSTTTSTAGITQVIRSNFSAFPFVGAASEGLEITNLFVPTSAARDNTGTNVTFTFAPPINIPPNADSAWPAFVVVTAPTPIALNEMRLVSGNFSDVIQVWSPVPEPHTWVALLAGVGLLAGLRCVSRR